MVAASGSLHIDLSEEIMDYEAVRRLFVSPKKPNGITRRTFENWINNGLEAWNFMGLVRTTRQALERFSVRIEPLAATERPKPRRKARKEAAEQKAEAAMALSA